MSLGLDIVLPAVAATARRGARPSREVLWVGRADCAPIAGSAEPRFKMAAFRRHPCC